MYTAVQDRQASDTDHMKESLKIILFSKCRLRYFGLYYICRECKEFTLLGSEDTFPEDITLLASAQPDLFIVDQALLMSSSAQPEEILREFHQIARVLIIADQINLAFACSAIASGIDGYLLTSVSQDEMLQALRIIAQGSSWLELSFVKMLVEHIMNSKDNHVVDVKASCNSRQLSEREQQILRLLARGNTCKEIAKELYLSESSVRTYWYRIMNKLNAVNKAEAIMIAGRAGFLDNLTPEHELAGRRKK